MINYSAGYRGEDHKYSLLIKHIRNRLISYYYMKPSLTTYYLETYQDNYEHIMIDSGAFSVWNKRKTIDLDDYIIYCLKYVDSISYVVNLDVIPGKPGQRPSKEEVERSATAGYRNYQTMIRKGIPKEKLIHVFHQGENFKWLEKMVREMDYIGLSPANDRSTKAKMEWLKECMPYVTDSDGRPTIRFHGFGVGSIKMIRMFPFYSVDSTAWGRDAQYKCINIPWKYSYPNPHKWYYSSENITCNLKTIADDSRSIHRMREDIQNDIKEYLTDMGVSIGSVSYTRQPADYELRPGESFLHPDLNTKLELKEHGTVDPAFRWVRTSTEGAMVCIRQRQYLNSVFINAVADTLGDDHRYAGGLSEVEKRKRMFRYHLRRHLVYKRVIPEEEQFDIIPANWYLAQTKARRIVAPPPVLGM
jgi:hypothetical protein